MECNCSCRIDASGRELVQHGDALLPAAAYNDDLVNWPVEWHWHDELEAGLIVEGSAVIGVGSRRDRLDEGEGFFINAGTLHGATPAGDGPSRIHSIVFHPRLVGGSPESIYWQKYLLPLTRNDRFEYLRLPLGDACSRSLLHAWDAMSKTADGYEFAVRADLSEIVRQVLARAPRKAEHVSEKTLRDSGRVKEMLQFIQENYAEPICIAQIAASAAVSKTECLRCFRSVLSTTPIQYVKTYRLQKAAVLLETTDLKVSEIGVACGFSEMSYFARSFRQSKGCTPMEYRGGHRTLAGE